MLPSSPIPFSPPPNQIPSSKTGRPRQIKTITTRRTTQKKVYGKRKIDAPRAVFEDRSPVKGVEKSKPPKKETRTDKAQIQNSPGQKTVKENTEKRLSDRKARKSSIERILGDVEDRFARIRIDGSQSPLARKEEVEGDYKVERKKNVSTANFEIHEEKTPVKRSSPKNIFTKSQRHYETMMEVRIYPGKDMTKGHDGQPQQLKESNQNTTPVTERQTRRTSKPKSKPAPRLSSGCIHDEKATAYVQPILNEALSPVSSQGVQKFASWAARAGNMFEVVKLAEGSYGEVYKLRFRPEMCKQAAGLSKSKLARLQSCGEGVFKVVPLRAQSGPGSKKFTSIDEIASEVKMLKYLDPIPGFARFREIHVVQGRFPESFQNAWMHYKRTKPADDCLNPNPASKKAYPDTQLWAILEMDDAGCELEKLSWASVFQIYDIFWGVAMALARAEEYALFEHRDLHLGNVCIRTTRSDGCMDPPTDLDIASQQYSSGFGLSTLETTIIDYSLSRADLRSDDGKIDVASSDLDKKEIFDAIGRDEDEILLRNTYRYMRAELYKGQPLDTEKTPDIPGIWSEYAPRTNLIWLLFLLKNLLKNRKPEPSPSQQQAAPRRALLPCSPNTRRNTPRGGKQILAFEKQQQHIRRTGTNNSEALLQVSLFKKILEDRLISVLELLDLEHGHEDMCCAADLVAYAIDEGWLDERDFF